jgi:hypothetical protein
MKRQVQMWVSAVCVVGLASFGVPSAAVGAAVPAASQVACGDVLTTDVVLSQDLVCPGPVGLSVRGSVRIDLNGHRLVGPGSAVGGTAILLLEEPGVSAVVVGGTISAWGRGMTGEYDVGQMEVDMVTFTQNGIGVYAIYNQSADIVRSRFEANGTGVATFMSGRVTVEESTLSGNGTAVDAGSTSVINVVNSKVINNERAVAVLDGTANVAGSLLKDNGTGYAAGILGGGRISDSTILGNEVGADLDLWSYTTFDRNTFKGNEVAIRAGMLVHSDISDSTFQGNGTGFLAIAEEVGSGSTLLRNTFVRNVDGIFINVTSGPGPSLGGNLAVKNSGWGIYAVGATDLGGNMARQNGNEPQCTGVSC